MRVCIETGFCDNKTRRRTLREAVLSSREVFFMFVTHHEKEKKNIISGSNADDTAKTSDLCYRSQNTDEGGIFKHENMMPNTHTKFLKKTRTENMGRDVC